ncbi:hypothetical protein [Raineyella fluvialis]|uniref:Uncharacterized protein n=1 Tax=Raineyella fluvialis TaxID=2662261 RepID=A0A5Q2FHS3_9ACTN|nr:hypothetical protein [Raineyella fluvialis]QGF23906.1 hypothetical protein Rai3103_09695 [Raineyella fluvialis]
MRHYEMRDLAAAPRFANPDLDLGNPAMVSTRPAQCDLTVLDTPDRRLLRAEIVLAHRSTEGEGQWLMAAPSWVPQLPAERLEEMTSGQVPDHILTLLAPFLRHAPLVPVGTQHRSRTTYLIRTTARETLGSVVDDVYTVRREGALVTRYREVDVDTGTMTREQIDWLDEALHSVEAVRVDRHLSLPARFRVLIADHGNDESQTAQQVDLSSVVGSVDIDASMAQIISHFVGEGVRQVLLADLNVRSGRTRKVQPLVRGLRTFVAELPVIAPVLPPGHLDELVAELGAAADRLDGAFGADQDAVLNGDDYLGIYERVSALRDPTLTVGVGNHPARDEIGEMVAAATGAMLVAGGTAPDAADDSGWHTAALAADRLVATAELASLLAPKQAKKLRDRARNIYDDLIRCDNEELEALRASLGGSSVEDAFGIGRQYATLAESRSAAREEFVEHWPKDARHLRKAGSELLARLGADGTAEGHGAASQGAVAADA